MFYSPDGGPADVCHVGSCGVCALLADAHELISLPYRLHHMNTLMSIAIMNLVGPRQWGTGSSKLWLICFQLSSMNSVFRYPPFVSLTHTSTYVPELGSLVLTALT